MAKRARRAKVQKNNNEVLLKILVGCIVGYLVLFRIIPFLVGFGYGMAMYNEAASDAYTLSPEGVEEILVEKIEVETIEDNFKPITFENSSVYWD